MSWTFLKMFWGCENILEFKLNHRMSCLFRGPVCNSKWQKSICIFMQWKQIVMVLVLHIHEYECRLWMKKEQERALAHYSALSESSTRVTTTSAIFTLSFSVCWHSFIVNKTRLSFWNTTQLLLCSTTQVARLPDVTALISDRIGLLQVPSPWLLATNTSIAFHSNTHTLWCAKGNFP